MPLLTATGCRSWSDFAAMCGCYALVFVPLAAMCWPN